MRDDVRREFEKRIRDLRNERIEAEMEEWTYDSEERTIWIVDAHRDNGKRFVVRSDEKKSSGER
jgi:hypothetical protein